MKPLLQFIVTVIVALALLAGAVEALAWYGGRPIVNTPTAPELVE